MTDAGPAGGSRRGKRRGRGGGQGGPERGGGGGRKRQRRRRDNRGGGNKARLQDRMPPQGGDESSILGHRQVTERRSRAVAGPPDAFELFCSYFLGITPEDGYQKPNLDEIARRHGMTPEEIKGLLVKFDLEPGVVRSTVDLEGALLDIRVAPAGISRTEIARDFFEEYVAARASAGEG